MQVNVKPCDQNWQRKDLMALEYMKEGVAFKLVTVFPVTTYNTFTIFPTGKDRFHSC